jgi:deazaflavin-dependent oxidoreductase (nitroreductase family)
MAISSVVARFNRRVWNPLVRGAAGRLPPFAVLSHRGRVSGRAYRTPVAAFPTGDGVLIALVFGQQADWVRNVLAQGGADLLRRGQTIALTNPELRHVDAVPAGVPMLIRAGLKVLRTRTFLFLQPRREALGPTI